MGKQSEVGKGIRRKVLEMAYGAGRGHVGGGLSAVEIMEALYLREPPLKAVGDAVVVAKGHCGELVYAVLEAAGEIGREKLERWGTDGAEIGDHIARGEGVVLGAGSLGHGIGVACGIALGKKLKGEAGVIFCVVGDGEMMEGSCWEAVLFAGAQGLGNLVCVVDRNGLMTLEEPPVGDLGKKFTVFGWEVVECNGLDASVIAQNLTVSGGGKPKAVIAHTKKGAGVSFMEGVARWHHGVPNEEEFRRAMEELA